MKFLFRFLYKELIFMILFFMIKRDKNKKDIVLGVIKKKKVSVDREKL